MTNYTQGYRDGLEAAAKVCDHHAKLYNIYCEPSAESSAINAAKAIRNLPVPSPKDKWLDELTDESLKLGLYDTDVRPSVEDVAMAIRNALCTQFPDNGTSDAFVGRAMNSTVSAWMWVAAKAAMRACGLKVEG